MEKKLSFELCSDVSVSNFARIVATMGPASFHNLEQIVKYGTIRINMAFINEDNYQDSINMIKRVRKNGGNRINIMLDAVGPRVKLGKLPDEGIELIKDKLLIISTKRDQKSTSDLITTIFKTLPQCVKLGDPVILAEGKFKLEIVRTLNEFEVECKVIRGGLLKKRGINLPLTDLNVPALSDEDRQFLSLLLAGDEGCVDTIALSFVRNKQDVMVLKEFLQSVNRPEIKIMSKIETQNAVDCIQEIAEISDSLMVARGDLWAELKDCWSLPRVTKQIIKSGHNCGIPVIAATQTLSSMCNNDLPSRAEVDELYFLLMEGSDCIMGSEEFATGKYPNEVISAIQNMAYQYSIERALKLDHHSPVDSYRMMPGFESHRAAIIWAEHSQQVVCIVVISQFGTIVKEMYKKHPNKPIVVITNQPATARYLQQFQVYVILSNFDDQDSHLLVATQGMKQLNWKFEEQKSAILCINNPKRSHMVQEVPFPN